MQISARYQAVYELIIEIFADRQPADNILNAYFRERRYIGSKDRRFISEEVWDIIRHRRRLEFDAQSNNVRKMLLVRYKGENLAEIFAGGQYGLAEIMPDERQWLNELEDDDRVYPADVEAECPQPFFDKINNFELIKSLNFPATADFRINAGSRETVIRKMRDEGFEVEAMPFSPIGIRAKSRINLNNCMAYLDGLIEPQDEASQLAAILADVRPEHKIVDYCCGAGGKSLTMAYLMHNQGTIEAHDVDERRLEALAPRIKRLQAARIRTVKTSDVGSDYDRFVIDAPCSGSGTWRRSPDAKFRLTEKRLDELVKIQAELLDMATEKVKHGGRIVYITCSVFDDENHSQIENFRHRHSDFSPVDLRSVWQEKIEAAFPFATGEYLQFNPLTSGTDGFFLAVLEKNK
uniref:rRNA cytosine-C5-methylase n=1 Tax=uncultured Alphaproteobacteria bacterium TaxID=91750 RepID=A0A6G8F3B6_9PROT|nr:rRNA cytosine-C5-methylase [uncultured Alphaproteobacteria bacterium]